MSNDKALIAKGLREPLAGVLAQARYHAALATLHAEALATKKWSAADTEALVAATAAIDTAKAQQLDERTGALGDTRDQAKAVSEAKTLIQQLRLALPLVLADNAADLGDIDKKTFAVPGGELGRSPAAVSAYLNQISPALGKLDPFLAGYFDDQTFSELARAAKAKLDQATTTQDLSQANLPDEALAVQEQKGRVLKLIDRLNAIGKLRFHGDATTSGKFNKDLLLAARKSRPEPKPTPPA